MHTYSAVLHACKRTYLILITYRWSPNGIANLIDKYSVKATASKAKQKMTTLNRRTPEKNYIARVAQASSFYRTSQAWSISFIWPQSGMRLLRPHESWAGMRESNNEMRIRILGMKRGGISISIFLPSVRQGRCAIFSLSVHSFCNQIDWEVMRWKEQLRPVNEFVFS